MSPQDKLRDFFDDRCPEDQAFGWGVLYRATVDPARHLPLDASQLAQIRAVLAALVDEGFLIEEGPSRGDPRYMSPRVSLACPI